MPGFPNASISMGFNFWDDDTPDDPKAVTANPPTSYEDNLADAESNADEEMSYGLGNGATHGPVPTAAMVSGDTSGTPTMTTAETSTRGPKNGVSTPSASPESESVPQVSEQDEEEDDSGASEAEVRLRADGQTFVQQRKITADLDMTDQMIVNLKNANHPNDYIAEELRKAGLVPYDCKTVGSRFIRLQKKIAEREAQRLEDELTDWHEGEVSSSPAMCRNHLTCSLT
jgi:hypothetical protein